MFAMPSDVRKFSTDSVRVAKIVGNAVNATTVVKGLCMPRNVHGNIKEVFDAKIAVYGIPLDSVSARIPAACARSSIEITSGISEFLSVPILGGDRDEGHCLAEKRR